MLRFTMINIFYNIGASRFAQLIFIAIVKRLEICIFSPLRFYDFTIPLCSQRLQRTLARDKKMKQTIHFTQILHSFYSIVIVCPIGKEIQ